MALNVTAPPTVSGALFARTFTRKVVLTLLAGVAVSCAVSRTTTSASAAFAAGAATNTISPVCASRDAVSHAGSAEPSPWAMVSVSASPSASRNTSLNSSRNSEVWPFFAPRSAGGDTTAGAALTTTIPSTLSP